MHEIFSDLDKGLRRYGADTKSVHMTFDFSPMIWA